VSHSKERKEKICLNCGAAVYGRYCHVCGQENLEPKESFWHLVTHFVYDIVHFDGKFFSTLKYLLFWPGHLSHEYLRGRRMSYLHPIKMYVFTSAFFFLIFFTFYKDLKIIQTNTTTTNGNVEEVLKELRRNKSVYEKMLLNVLLPKKQLNEVKQKLVLIDSDIAIIQRDSTKKNQLLSYEDGIPEISTSFSKKGYKSLKEYDSVQASLAPDKRDGKIRRFLEERDIKRKEKYGNNHTAYWDSLKEDFTHHFPQLLFTSLPLFALLLQLLYRRRKQFFYMNHAIFTIHLYCATFIIILLRLWTTSLFHWFHSEIPYFLRLVFTFAILLYWYKAFRNFYQQKRGKTILKFIILMFLSMFLMIFLFGVFLFFSAITI